MDSGTFAALNKEFPEARLRFRQHDVGAYPYRIAKDTHLINEPGIENVHHAANLIWKWHSATLNSHCFGPKNLRKHRTSLDARRELRRLQEEAGVSKLRTSSKPAGGGSPA